MSENSSRTHSGSHSHRHHKHRRHHRHHKKSKITIFQKIKNKVLVDCGKKEISLLLVIVLIMIVIIPVVVKILN